MIPTSLYIHVPWCVRKCPYCDFNSHPSPDQRPDDAYFKALSQDLKQELDLHPPKDSIQSIFIGGGTPSLIEPHYYERLFHEIQAFISFSESIEITLEANPGTLDESKFKDYHALGINRLSIGIQSFNATALKALGRIHDDKAAHHAIEVARKAGFQNINLDLMHGLPHQTPKESMEDLKSALSYQPEHLSWYQLTLEKNTVFYKAPPPLPNEDLLSIIETEGLAFLLEQGYEHYEISAFCQPGRPSQHNLNYWLFGDYYGIGAGAHGKWTAEDNSIFRTQKPRMPKSYIDAQTQSQPTKLTVEDIRFEFMLNASRLNHPIPLSLYQERTHRPLKDLMPGLIQAEKKGFIVLNQTHWQVTPLGRRFTNDLQTLFLE